MNATTHPAGHSPAPNLPDFHAIAEAPSRLDTVRLYAAAGWPIFPVVPGTKAPAIERGYKAATTDPGKLAKWWTENPDFEAGLAVDAAGLMVIDFDTGSDPDALADTYDLPATLTATTPSGGTHEYYFGHSRNTAGKLAENVDTRGQGGYVLLPLPGNGYAFDLAPDAITVPAPVPAKLVEAIGKPKAKERDIEAPENPHNLPVDVERNASAYADWLATEAEAPAEGERNVALAGAAAMGRSYALSADTTLSLIREIWNPRLTPPLDDEEIEISGRSGYASASSAFGNLTPEYRTAKVSALFEDRTTGDNSDPVERHRFKVLTRTELDAIPPPVWMVDDMLTADSYCMIYGPPKAGKSTLAIDLALTIAAGKPDWYGRTVNQSGRVLYAIGEGQSFFGQQVRAWEAKRNSGDPVSNFLTVAQVPQLDSFDQFAGSLADHAEGYSVIVLDTVSRMLAGQNENDQAIASALTLYVDELRRRFGCTVIVVHHENVNTGRERGSSVFRGDVDTLLRYGDGELSMIFQRAAPAWDKPMTFRTVSEADGGATLELLPEFQAKAQKIKKRKTPAMVEEANRQEAYALDSDKLAAKMLAAMPRGGEGWSTRRAAQFLAGHKLNVAHGNWKEGTWEKYLRVLKAHDTDTRAFYDNARERWINKGVFRPVAVASRTQKVEFKGTKIYRTKISTKITVPIESIPFGYTLQPLSCNSFSARRG